jgi:hypothetical protein
VHLLVKRILSVLLYFKQLRSTEFIKTYNEVTWVSFVLALGSLEVSAVRLVFVIQLRSFVCYKLDLTNWMYSFIDCVLNNSVYKQKFS